MKPFRIGALILVALLLVGLTSASSANSLYSYVEIPLGDGTTRNDGTPRREYFCLLWKTEWSTEAVMTRNFDEGRGLKYTVNSSSRAIHAFAVRRLNERRWVPVDFYVKMYDEPQPGWD